MEKPAQSHKYNVASVIRRIGAYMVDRVIIYMAMLLLVGPFILKFSQNWTNRAATRIEATTTYSEFLEILFEETDWIGLTVLIVIAMGLYALIAGLYVIPQVAIWSKTLGKRVFSIEIVSFSTGDAPVGWGRSFRRWILPSVSAFFGAPGGIVNTVGFLWIFTNVDRRAWHDLIADTIVVTQGTTDASP